MRLRYLIALLLAAIPMALAEGLPELGDPAQAALTPLQDRKLGESIMREARRDPSFYDDAEVTDYINRIGQRLVTRGAGSLQSFEFFMMRDPQINAFALPGGHIGVNTGLLLAAQSESELAGVLAHEISHVTQRHIARMISGQQANQWISIAALAIAILAARSNSQVAEAAATIGPALSIQQQLNFSRDFEREADRVGLQLLDKSGFDPRGMEIFFERLQRATRIYEGGAPSYLRTHPLTHERIADIQNRVQDLPYRQVADDIDFHLIRAKLKAQFDAPREAVTFFRESVSERRFLSEAGSRYGLTAALLRIKDYAGAKREYTALHALVPSNAIVDGLGCRLRTAAGDADALTCLRDAVQKHPLSRALAYDYIEALLQARQPEPALKLTESRLQTQSDDHQLYLLQARAYAMLNKRLAQSRAQAEAYVRMGNLTAAVEQLQIGLKTGDGDFYQMSATEARLRQLRVLDAEERKDAKQK